MDVFTVPACHGSSGSPADVGVDAAGHDAALTDAALTDAAIDAPVCPTTPCDLLEQCGCAGALVCDIDFSDLNGYACRSVTVPGTEGSSCATPAQCAGGHLCLGGTCQRWCGDDSACTAPRGQCVTAVGGVTTPGPVGVCSPSCDPVSSGSSCGVGNKCAFAHADSPPVGLPREYVTCAAAGNGAQGASCSVGGAPNDALCAANFQCTQVGPTDMGHCRHVCRVDNGSADCAGTGATTCVAFAPGLIVGGIEYGTCN